MTGTCRLDDSVFRACYQPLSGKTHVTGGGEKRATLQTTSQNLLQQAENSLHWTAEMMKRKKQKNRLKWRIFNRSSSSFSPQRKEKLKKHNTLELLLICWKCFGFPDTHFPAFISSHFPVCFRTFGREPLSSWSSLSDDDTWGPVQTNANDLEPPDSKNKQ